MFFRTAITLLLAGCLIAASAKVSFLSSAEVPLPSTQQFNDVLATCALSLEVTIDARLLGSVKSLYEGQRTSGAASFRTQTKFLELFPESERAKVYQLYTNCIRGLMPPNGQYAYLKDLYEKNGILYPMGWGYGVPKELIENQKEPLAIYPTGAGVFEPAISFVVSSSVNANVKVEKLYLKLKSYIKCDRRDDRWKGTLGDQEDANVAIFMSEDYDVYPIKPTNANLTTSSWVFKGRDLNNFNIRIESKPYVLYLFSVNIDYLDLNANENRHVESDQFSQILTKGNMDGCLNIGEWLRDNMEMKKPSSNSYDDGIPYDIYQLLTADFAKNPGSMNVFLNNRSLIARKTLVQATIARRANNKIFRSNYNSWIQALTKR